MEITRVDKMRKETFTVNVQGKRRALWKMKELFPSVKRHNLLYN